MSRPTSRLTTLLRVRGIQEEIRRGRLAAEVVAERRAQMLLEQARERYADPVAEPPVDEMVPSFVASRHHRDVLAITVCNAGSGVEAAAEVTLAARHDWSEAAMRLAALERLEDRVREAESAQMLADEQRTVEESSSAQHARKLVESAPETRP